MASMYYDKKTKRWRVAWHVNLPDGTVDSGSKTFGKDKKTAKRFKEHCEKRAKQIKRTVFVDVVHLDVALQDWEDYCLGYTKQTRKHYTLEINDLPQTDKPDTFYGLVGSYTITANAAPTQVNVGDPITLKIKIGGSQYLKPVQWPSLEQIPEIASSFKIPSEYADGEIEDGAKLFTQTIRANNHANHLNMHDSVNHG
jgi:hypothetical protein